MKYSSVAISGVLLLAVVGCGKNSKPTPANRSSTTTPGESRESAPSCGNQVVGDSGVGNLRIGASVESLRATCTVVRDTTAMGAEGMPARKVTVSFGRDTLQAEIVDGRVWRISIFSPRFRTADSLGVGTPIARLLELKGPRGLTGEGELFVVSPEHCGLSFGLSDAGPASHRGDWDRASLARLPRQTVVDEVLIVGCPTRQPQPVRN